MVRKEDCPNCKGNKIIKVDGKYIQCRECNGQGFKIKIVHGYKY